MGFYLLVVNYQFLDSYEGFESDIGVFMGQVLYYYLFFFQLFYYIEEKNGINLGFMN